MLIRIETASPPYKVPQLKAKEELKKRMADRPAIARLIDSAAKHSGIESRYVVVPDAEDSAIQKFYNYSDGQTEPDIKKRMMEYEKWSKELTGSAVKNLLARTGFDPKKLDRLITISCTGFFAPGLDYFLINKFGFPLSVKRTNIGFMGCAASIVGFNSVFEAMNSTKGNSISTLLVSVELCSLHLQINPTRDNILANMIFADGAAAVLFSNSESMLANAKLELIETKSFMFENSYEYMGWKIGNLGFEMMLSSDLPKIILEKAAPHLISFLSSSGIKREDIKHWALHPGGRAVLDSLQTGLDLSDDEMIASRKVLNDYGNMSSVTILFVLKEIIDSGKIKKDDLCCAVAFGPGLTMEVALFKGV